jgi:hypothetical protein
VEIDNQGRINELQRSLREQLTGDQFDQVRELTALQATAEGLAVYDDIPGLIGRVAEHFPAFAPAIRAVAEHMLYADKPLDTPGPVCTCYESGVSP